MGENKSWKFIANNTQKASLTLIPKLDRDIAKNKTKNPKLQGQCPW
jgi:hypothetical protein